MPAVVRHVRRGAVTLQCWFQILSAAARSVSERRVWAHADHLCSRRICSIRLTSRPDVAVGCHAGADGQSISPSFPVFRVGSPTLKWWRGRCPSPRRRERSVACDQSRAPFGRQGRICVRRVRARSAAARPRFWIWCRGMLASRWTRIRRMPLGPSPSRRWSGSSSSAPR